MKKRVFLCIGVLYVIFSIIVTVFIFKRNENGAFETSDNLYVHSSKIEEYSSSSLVRFSKKDNIANMVDKEIYYFDSSKKVKKGKMTSYSTNDKVFVVDDDPHDVSLYLGIPNKEYKIVGAIISFFTNKIVFLIFIIIPVIVLLIYELYLLYRYKRSRDNKNEKNTK